MALIFSRISRNDTQFRLPGAYHSVCQYLIVEVHHVPRLLSYNARISSNFWTTITFARYNYKRIKKAYEDMCMFLHFFAWSDLVMIRGDGMHFSRGPCIRNIYTATGFFAQLILYRSFTAFQHHHQQPPTASRVASGCFRRHFIALNAYCIVDPDLRDGRLGCSCFKVALIYIQMELRTAMKHCS